MSRRVRASSSGDRTRISRPCTLMIEQKLQLKGQPRLQSMVPKFEMMNFLRYFRSNHGYGLRIEVRFAIQEIVDGLQTFFGSVPQDVSPGLFHLALDHRNPEVDQFLYFRRRCPATRQACR